MLQKCVSFTGLKIYIEWKFLSFHLHCLLEIFYKIDFKVNKPDDLYNLFIIFACVEKYIFLISYNVLFIRFWFLEAI